MQINSALKWLVLAYAAFLFLTNLFTHGMFLDGMLYATVARNLSEGLGSRWSPFFPNQPNNIFYENPPFYMWCESFLFRLTGDLFFTERLFSILVGFLNLFIILKIWQAAASREGEKSAGWIAILCWLIIPIVSWSYSNNMMEGLMSVFTNLSVLFLILFINQGKLILIYSLLSGLALLLAFMTKSVGGLFPLAAPLFLIGCNEFYGWKKMALYTFLQGMFLAALLAVLFSFEAPREFAQGYWMKRLEPVILQKSVNQPSRFFLLGELLRQLLVVLVLTSIVLLATARWKSKSFVTNYSAAFRFILIGCAASLPILISREQRSHYLVTSMSFFAIGFSFLLSAKWEMLQERIKGRWRIVLPAIIKTAAVLLFALSIGLCISNMGKIGRDKKLVTDLLNVSSYLEKDKAIAIDESMRTEWPVYVYFYRYYFVPVRFSEDDSDAFLCISKNELSEWKDGRAVELIYRGQYFNLYRYKQEQGIAR